MNSYSNCLCLTSYCRHSCIQCLACARPSSNTLTIAGLESEPSLGCQVAGCIVESMQSNDLSPMSTVSLSCPGLFYQLNKQDQENVYSSVAQPFCLFILGEGQHNSQDRNGNLGSIQGFPEKSHRVALAWS